MLNVLSNDQGEYRLKYMCNMMKGFNMVLEEFVT